jgi:acetyl esterase/lipase
MPAYTLAPEARIRAMTREVAASIEQAATEVSGPIRLIGHSAGGHLVTRMLCADVPLAAGVRSRIAHVVSLSGLHDLRPFLKLAMNETLRLDAAEAVAESPALLTPVEGTPVTAWVGGDELPEFLRQTRLLPLVWGGLGIETNTVEEPGRHHFDVIDGLTDPGPPVDPGAAASLSLLRSRPRAIVVHGRLHGIRADQLAETARRRQRCRLRRIAPHQVHAGIDVAGDLQLHPLLVSPAHVLDDLVGLVDRHAELDQGSAPEAHGRFEGFADLVIDTGMHEVERMAAIEGAGEDLGMRGTRP